MEEIIEKIEALKRGAEKIYEYSETYSEQEISSYGQIEAYEKVLNILYGND